MDVELFRKIGQPFDALDGRKRNLSLEGRFLVLAGRLLIVPPDSLAKARLRSGRNSTYNPVQILEPGSCRPQRAPSPVLRNASLQYVE